jgi:hypothetical protein
MNEEAPFQAMAERIRKIADDEFAGAVVIQPPGGAEPIAFLITDPAPDLLQFFASVKARVEIAYSQASEQVADQPGAGWNRR